MKRHGIAFGVAVLALGLVQVVRGADVPNPVGFPKKGDPGGGVGAVRIWYADSTWHLRTSTEDSVGDKDQLMVFTGSVHCEDKMKVDGYKLETGKGQTADMIVPHADGKGFDFRFATFGALDQADFTVGPKGKKLKFQIAIDGEKAQTSRILIGEDGVHPEKAEFTLPAQVMVEKK